jgi:hypothetical protein
MKTLMTLALVAAGAALSGCVVLPYHEENAALVAPRPSPPPAELAYFAKPDADYPTVGGDILKRVPEELGPASEAPVTPR